MPIFDSTEKKKKKNFNFKLFNSGLDELTVMTLFF